MTSKCGKNKKVAQEAIAKCHWCCYHILTSSVIYYCTDTRQHGYIITGAHHHGLLLINKQTTTAFTISKSLIFAQKLAFAHFGKHEKSNMESICEIETYMIFNQSAWMRHVYFLWGNFWINIITTMIRYEQIVHNNVSQCSVGHSMWWVSLAPLYFKTINKAKHASDCHAVVLNWVLDWWNRWKEQNVYVKIVKYLFR